MTVLARYFYTIRYLLPTQVVGRAVFKLWTPRPNLAAPPGIRARTREYVAPIAPDPSLVSPYDFVFLNERRHIATAADWQSPNVAKLWIYNLHYFDDLNAEGADERVTWHAALLDRWVKENPPGSGVGWEPYPVSRRIVSWVKWAARGHELSPQCCASLAVQARWLAKRLEYHILGNHLFVNAKALVHAGLFFDAPEAERWLATGTALLARQVPEQILPDGGHFERSTMYHAAALEDLLDLVNLLTAYGRTPPSEWLAAIARMRSWLRLLTHPDGEIAFFNDAAFGIAPARSQLDRYATRLGLPADTGPSQDLVTLDPSGYVRAVAGPAYLVCDCAPVGPDYQPGHAHADTLSFELSVAAQRVLVNSGTSVYGADVERQRQRSTAAHNTVTVDGQNSSEVWSGFRVARRARARLHDARQTQRAIVIRASHDGYHRLPGRVIHTRTWVLDQGSLTIKDQLTGRFQAAEARFHVHPSVTVTVTGPSEVALRWSDGTIGARFEGVSGIQVQPSTWHPRFGNAVPNTVIVARFAESTLTSRWSGQTSSTCPAADG